MPDNSPPYVTESQLRLHIRIVSHYGAWTPLLTFTTDKTPNPDETPKLPLRVKAGYAIVVTPCSKREASFNSC